MHPIQKLWNLATGLQKARVDFKILRQRMEDAVVQLAIDPQFDWVNMIPYVNSGISRGLTFWDYLDEEEIDADSWLLPQPEVAPSIPDFTQPPPHIDQETGEVMDEEPDPRLKKKTKATAKADTAKLMIMKYLSVIPETWVSSREVSQLFKDEISERTIKRYLEDLFTDKQVVRKNEYQRISATKTTKRHLYKFCLTTRN
jgi:hypothetical protein